jgi:hypothetical protein
MPEPPATTCPTCGCRVRVHTGEEGTVSFVSMDVARLVEALEPFAARLDEAEGRWERYWPDGAHVPERAPDWLTVLISPFEIGDYRRAAEALRPLPPSVIVVPSSHLLSLLSDAIAILEDEGRGELAAALAGERERLKGGVK